MLHRKESDSNGKFRLLPILSLIKFLCWLPKLLKLLTSEPLALKIIFPYLHSYEDVFKTLTLNHCFLKSFNSSSLAILVCAAATLCPSLPLTLSCIRVYYDMISSSPLWWNWIFKTLLLWNALMDIIANDSIASKQFKKSFPCRIQ